MQTVFSHIIQKRFSQVNEDVATDALAFILQSSDLARKALLKMLRGIAPDMPNLHFQTQQTEGSIRPDMWGLDGSEPRVFVENKFWAGLTNNQPVAYLKQLSKYAQPSVLLFVAPEARQHTLWRELNRRIKEANITTAEQESAAGIVCCTATQIGPILALTSWRRLLSILELEVADEPGTRSDLLQLRALCEAADQDAFVPISAEEVSDQRLPALILQLNTIVQALVELAVNERILKIGRLKPQANWERIGRYASFRSQKEFGVWIGIHFELWKKHGQTPLWLLFPQGEWGRAQEVQPLLEPLAAKQGFLITEQNGDLAIAIEIAIGEDKDQVVKSIVERLKVIVDCLY